MATGNQVLKAYSKAVRNMENQPIAASCAVSAGFIFKPGQKRGMRMGYQVFVKVCRYSDVLMKEDPLNGGLLCGKP